MLVPMGSSGMVLAKVVGGHFGRCSGGTQSGRWCLLRHCEERSDEAIRLLALDCFAALAMTVYFSPAKKPRRGFSGLMSIAKPASMRVGPDLLLGEIQ